jgi:hypothetical protein
MRLLDSGDVVFSDYCARVTFFFSPRKKGWKEGGLYDMAGDWFRVCSSLLGLHRFGGGVGGGGGVD